MDSANAVPASIGERYEIERELGRGGMATVYLARDVPHDRLVAVKVMRSDVSASVGAERFLREVRVVSSLSHPHILALYDSGRAPARHADVGRRPGDELLYYVMPYVDGESLRDRLRREGALPVGDALRIASEIADALAFAHAQGIVHRDIKPENVLLSGSGRGSAAIQHAIVADFGIARVLAESGPELTATGISVGTPAYMSPEQAAGERTVDARSDIYSLGCLLYEMLVGEPPFTGPNVSVIVARHLTAPVPSIRAVRPTVPAELETLVHRALRKVPADRIASATAFRAAVDTIRAQSDGDADTATTKRPAPGRQRSLGHHAMSRWLLAALVVMAVFVGGFTWLRFARDPERRATISAHDAYLRGTLLAKRTPVPSRAVADSAIRYFEQAIARDSTHALAHTAIANIANTIYFNYEPDPAWEYRAFAEIEKALAIDPTLAEAYQAKGNLIWTRARGFPHEAAARLHRRAIALKPGYAEAHSSLAIIYMHVGLFDRALAEYDSALALDPTMDIVPPRIARVHWYQGKYPLALRELEALANRAASMAPERALVLNYLGRRDEALALLDTVTFRQGNRSNYDVHASRAVILAAAGRHRDARDEIDRALAGDTAASHFHHAAYSIAEAYALVGDRDRALEFLQRTASSGMPCYPLFRDDPHLRSLATDPRFVQFMTTLRQQYEHLAATID